MFKRILIANRGEIASRIARTARLLEIDAVAVYADPDRNAPFTRACDSAIPIGGITPAESYLNIDKILAAAEQCGAEAIHPGYGFLSENAEFAERCKMAGLSFVGPGAKAIRIMGSKDSARTAAIQSGVPVLPGYDGADQSPDMLMGQAEKIGYPVLIKATAGGGGKGMRVVNASSDFMSSLQSVKRESGSAFGDERVFIEKYLPSSRHIEIQVFADSHGNTVHLFERDCSMQRRYQKVVEESPATGLSDKLRDRMTTAAVNCAQAIDYVGAGTIEFLVDAHQFYFLEMNTRLQVEHPVTEMVTGQDLVEWQLRVAAGESLPCKQQDIKQNGHAIEVRIYAENPDRGFLPATGTVLDITEPEVNLLGQNARIDAGIAKGSRISPYYDPMIAKVIAWGRDRESALGHMAGLLRDYRILGVPTNISFLQSILEQPDFVASNYDTQYLARELDEVLSHIPCNSNTVHLACIWLFLNDLKSQQCKQAKQKDRYSPWLAFSSLRTEPNRKYHFECAIDHQHHVLSFLHDCGRFEFGDGVRANAKTINNQEMMVSIRDQQTVVYAAHADNTVFMHMDGQHHRIDIADIDQAERDRLDATGSIFSPMPGTVTDVRVVPEQLISKGDCLLSIEAMKMEHDILAPSAGKVKSVHCKAGSSVAENTPLVTIEPA